MHHPHSYSLGPQQILLPLLLIMCAIGAPDLAMAQSSPFLTGATALQTNILSWLTPIAIILVMVLGGMAMANRIAQEHDVLTVLDYFGDETHAVACGAKSSTIP